MIKNAACIVALMAPCLSLALEQKELSTPPRLNLQLQSANTCSPRQNFALSINVSPYNQSSTSLRELCKSEITVDWSKNHIINSELTTWLRLNSAKSRDTKFIGLGFRLETAGDGVVRFRVRGGGLYLNYRTTFQL